MAVSGKKVTNSRFVDNIIENINKTGFWGGLAAFFGLAAFVFGAVLFFGGLLHALDIIWLWLLGLILMIGGVLDIYLVSWYGQIKITNK